MLADEVAGAVRADVMRLPLAVLVVMASLPVGSNPLIFAQRYGTLQAEATATIVLSTLAFVATLAGWLAVLAWIG